MSTSSKAAKVNPTLYQMYREARYGTADAPHIWIVNAVHAYRIATHRYVEMVQRRVVGTESALCAWTNQTIERGGYTFEIEMTVDNDWSMTDVFGVESLSWTLKRPQTRFPADSYQVAARSTGGYSTEYLRVTLEYGAPQLMAEQRRHYGYADAYRRAHEDVKRQVRRLTDLYDGSMFYYIAAVKCEALELDECCGGFESDDDEGVLEWIEDQIQCALSSIHQ